MKIRIDMQGVQTGSRHRGIGRHCLSVTREFIELATPGHDLSLLFNAALDGIDEAVTTLGVHGTGRFAGVFGPIRDTAMANAANDGRRVAAERIFTRCAGQRHTLLTAGQLTPPMLVGTPDERREQAEMIQFLPIQTVARLGFTPGRLRELIGVLEATLKNYEAQEQRFDPRNG